MTAPADAGDEALVNAYGWGVAEQVDEHGMRGAPCERVLSARTALLSRLASLRARAERAEGERDEATVRADRWSAMFGELKRTWDAEMDARAMVRGRLAHAGETFHEFVERMAAERDAARSALAECQRERNEAVAALATERKARASHAGDADFYCAEHIDALRERDAAAPRSPARRSGETR